MSNPDVNTNEQTENGFRKMERFNRPAAERATRPKEHAQDSSQPEEGAQASVHGVIEAQSFASPLDKRMELLHARMLTIAPFNRNPLALDAAWQTIETRLRAEPHILRGSISWLATVFAKIASTRKMRAGISVDPYADDVVFRCEAVELADPILHDVGFAKVNENTLASSYVYPYFTTQAMEAIVREFEECQFSVFVVRQNDEFSCSVRSGVPDIHHVIYGERSHNSQGHPYAGNPIVNAYACASYDNGARNKQVAIVGPERAEAAKKRSRDATSWDNDDSDSMWKKTALRDLISAMPLCPELRSLFALQRGGKNRRMIIETF